MNAHALLERWTERLRHEEPQAVAILCHGSYARGAAEAHSDLDLNVLVDREPTASYRSAFEELPDGRLLHVAIETTTLEEWLEQFAAPVESEAWAFYLQARQVAQLLWATPEAHAKLEGCVTLTFAAAPQLQDLLESAAKVRNAAARGDELGVRLAAQDLGVRCPALHGLRSPLPVVDSRRHALQVALDMTAGPQGYRDDLLTCLGLSGRATTMDEVHLAALRLAAGILETLQPLAGMLANNVELGLPEALADGRLGRLLTQPDGGEHPPPTIGQIDHAF